MNICAVEFDRTKFDTTCACEDFIRGNNDLSYLLDRKTFRLKSTVSRVISDESRQVWSWYDLWSCKVIKVERPHPYVVILRNVGSSSWDRTEIPMPLEITQEKRKKMELLRQKKEVHKKEIAEKAKLKRKHPYRQSNGHSKKSQKKKKSEKSLLETEDNSVVDKLLKETEMPEPKVEDVLTENAESSS